MADSKLFMIPFGASGDRAAIPDTVAPSGAVSWPQGFGPDYERDPATDPMAKRIPRDETNEYLYQITNAIKFLQLYGVPEWFPDDGAGNSINYPLGARVRHEVSGVTRVWRSLIANNTSTPGANFSMWTPYEEGAFLGSRIFRSSGSYVPTPGTRLITVEVVGGGGGGASSRSTSAGQYAGGAGGGGGGYAKSELLVSALSLPVSISVGAGGAANTTPAAGAASAFGSYLSASGGGGGVGTELNQYPINTVVQHRGGTGGVGSGGNRVNSQGGTGGILLLSSDGGNTAGMGGASAFGQGGRGGYGSSLGGVDGLFGSGGGGSVSQSSPSLGYAGGRGGDGVILIHEFA